MTSHSRALLPVHAVRAGVRRRTGTTSRMVLFATAGLAGAMTLQDPPDTAPTAAESEVSVEGIAPPPEPLLVIAYHDTGLRKRESVYANGRPEGVWMGWGEDGGLYFRGAYRQGLRHGIWQTYDRSTGALIEESHYQDGLRHGARTVYEEGRIALRGTYERGRRTGVWTTYGSGYIESTGSYEDDRRTGVWSFWHDRGRKFAEGPYEDGMRAGAWNYWLENGDLDDERTGFYEEDELKRSRRRR